MSLLSAFLLQEDETGTRGGESGTILKVEEGDGMSSRPQENDIDIARRAREIEMNRREEEIAKKEEEFAKKVEGIAQKEKEMVERQKDEDLRISNMVQAQLGSRVEEEIAFRAGNPWPPTAPGREAPQSSGQARAGRRASGRTTARR
ncbi:hypothetical protein TWF506_007475 [Arthrobotrys conoides]|uniref:Uncharacterized protein n=1 Tax=Arthrobotrys conoides TaxID=74498 RepID=A0AAN8RN99_9PEZI